MFGIYDWIMEKIFLPVFFFFALASIIAAPFAIYSKFMAETFSLKKNQWECVSSHKETHLIGKVISTENVCDEWRRK